MPHALGLSALLVEENPPLARLLKHALRAQRWTVLRAGDGLAISVRAGGPDVMVVDATQGPPLATLEGLRRTLPRVPVLFLVPPGPALGQIAGRTAAGDDFLPTSFNLAEATRRLRLLTYRAGVRHLDNDPVTNVGDLTINEDSQEIHRGNDEIHLAPREFELLVTLAHHQGRVLTRAEILALVWEYDFEWRQNVVTYTISRLRRHVDAGRSPIIRTVQGLGYILQQPGTNPLS